MVQVFVFKFRPSSHSEDYTIIATYGNAKAAEKVRDALLRLLRDMKRNDEEYDVDWDPDEAAVSLYGKEVWFQAYTAGRLDDVESVMRKTAKPEDIRCYENYQELTIRVRLPKGLTLETASLMLDVEEAEALKYLTNVCGKPRIEDLNENECIWTWFYEGDYIYDEDGYLYVPDEFSLVDRENWSVDFV